MVEHSDAAGDIVQGERAGAAMGELRDFMFEQRLSRARSVRAEHERIANVLRTLFEHYAEHPEPCPTAAAPRAPTWPSASPTTWPG